VVRDPHRKPLENGGTDPFPKKGRENVRGCWGKNQGAKKLWGQKRRFESLKKEDNITLRQQGYNENQGRKGAGPLIKKNRFKKRDKVYGYSKQKARSYWEG